MRTPILAVAAAAVVFTAALPSQAVVLPTSIATTGGVAFGGTFGIWSATEEAWQGIYDGSNFSSQGVTFPILINHLDFRGESNWALTGGGAYTSVVSMSGAPAGTWMAPSPVYAANHGGNVTQLFSGAHSVATPLTQTPNIFVAPFPLNALFLHDPTSTDLVVEIRSTPVSTLGTSWIDQGSAGADQAAQLHSNMGTGAATTATASTISLGRGVAIELKYVPASGLFPNFTVDVSSGPAPLTVNFTDNSFTSDPNGIVLYEWDLDGDGVFEQFGPALKLVSHTYNCGTYSPSLRVTDTLHGQVTKTKTNLIGADPMTADFSEGWSSNPLEVLFTDLSQFNPSSWQWDFESDGIIDSTLQNPTHTYPSAGNFSCTLVVGNACGNNDTITKDVSSVPQLCTTFVGGNGLISAGTGNYFDLEVLNPNGITITSLDVSTWTAGTPATIDVFLTGDTYLGQNGIPSEWRQVATGTGNTSGTIGVPHNIDINDIYLPPGKYGVAIKSSHGVRYTNGAPGTTNNNFFSNGDLILGAGASGTIFGTFTNTPRIWNGCIKYTAFATNVFGFNGEGCPSSAGHVEQALSAGSQPKIGTTLSIDVAPLPVGSPFHFMVIGFSNTVHAGIPLPVDLGTVPGANMPGCIARSSIDQLGIFSDLGGSGVFTIAVPPNAALVGTVAFTQPYVVDFAAPHGGRPMVTGDAAGMVVGM